MDTMPIWVNGCCVMKSPVAESDRSGDTITIKVLSRELGNTGWTVYTSLLTAPYMEDLYGRLQLVQPQDVADDTVAQIGAENRANHDNDDLVHIMNNFE